MLARPRVDARRVGARALAAVGLDGRADEVGRLIEHAFVRVVAAESQLGREKASEEETEQEGEEDDNHQRAPQVVHL